MRGPSYLSFGANLVTPYHADFRLWAPGQNDVSLVIEGRAPLPMVRDGSGWFEVEAECGSGTRYRYRLEDGRSIPDPASRAQAGDVHDWSVVVDPFTYKWRHRDWRGRPWEEAVLYELHVGLFGGFQGVARELPRLADLGVTAVELMPIAEFPGSRNWGYDGVMLFAPERSYGTPDDLKHLVDTAHEHGLMIFLDVVYNHFGPDGNYWPVCAPEMFRQDVTTPWGPAIDFRKPQVRRFFTENALYWLIEYCFDGLRFDAVHAIKDPDWLDEMAEEVRLSVEPNRNVHLVLENDENVASHLARDFDAQWNDDGHHVLHILLTGESDGYYGDYTDSPAEKLARCLAEGFIYQGERSFHRKGEPRGTPSAGLPPTAFVLFLQNHDQIGNRAFGERLTVLTEPAALEAAIALQLLCPQIPLLFMGEEHASREPFLFFTDHTAELAEAVRIGREREFSSFSQFKDSRKLASLPDPNAFETFSRSRPAVAPAYVVSRERLYRQLIALRHAEIIPRLNGARSVGAKPIGPAAVLARWQMGDGAILVIACNLGSKSASVPIQNGRLLFATSAALEESGLMEPWTTIAWLEEP